jgi:winged helix DNA-binding protein
MPVDVLSSRALNRATLERQLLLRRSAMPPLDAVEHLVGLQAQAPLNPYTALWSRLEGFGPDQLATLLERRQVVRMVLMRATIHLVTAEDCLLLRPLMQPVLDAELARHPEYGPALREVELEPVLAVARELFAQRPRTGPELRAALAERFPGENATALAYACRNMLPLIQVPPRGLWGRTAQVTSTTADVWLGPQLATKPSLDDVLLRFLAAFGPASVADATTWSRLTGLREVVERLRPQLRTFRNDDGRELFDLPDAPRPDPSTPAPPRFLPEYDNLLLSHADRSRFYVDRDRFSAVAGPVQGAVLNDGSVCGIWRIERDAPKGRATLVVEHVVRLTKRASVAVAVEARRFLRFVAVDADSHDVRFIPVE